MQRQAAWLWFSLSSQLWFLYLVFVPSPDKGYSFQLISVFGICFLSFFFVFDLKILPYFKYFLGLWPSMSVSYMCDWFWSQAFLFPILKYTNSSSLHLRNFSLPDYLSIYIMVIRTLLSLSLSLSIYIYFILYSYFSPLPNDVDLLRLMILVVCGNVQ